MMGFILNKDTGGDLKNLKPREQRALHECLVWCRDGSNNKVLQMFGTIFESFHTAAGNLMNKIRAALPEGSTACRIRASARETHRPTTGTLLETLGEESTGMVFLDPVGMPLKYDQLQVYRDIVGTSACRIEVDAEGKTRGSWYPTRLAFHTDDHPSLDDKWRKDLSLGAEHVLRESWITAGDAHYEWRLALTYFRAPYHSNRSNHSIAPYILRGCRAKDAKLWPHLHPYSSGSLYSEPGSGGMYRLVRNRLLIVQNGFRQNNLYAFWYLNRVITKEPSIV